MPKDDPTRRKTNKGKRGPPPITLSLVERRILSATMAAVIMVVLLSDMVPVISLLIIFTILEVYFTRSFVSMIQMLKLDSYFLPTALNLEHRLLPTAKNVKHRLCTNVCWS